MQYFIDIGNTRIKYTQAQQPFSLDFVTHDNISPLLNQLSLTNTTQLLIVTGRSQQAQQSLSSIVQFAKQHRMTVKHVTVNSKWLTVNYTDISQFGCDRFLNLLAAKEQFQQNFCVVSCGTAITLDFFAHRHIGGMILPGLGLSKQLLAEKAGLPNIEKPQHLLGHDTASSIGSGLYFGYQNLITESIRRIEKELSLSFTVGFTGGDAEVLCQKAVVIDNLLFTGMAIYQKYIEHNNKH